MTAVGQVPEEDPTTGAITRSDVALALLLAVDAAEGRKRTLEPEPGSSWSRAQSRELEATDYVVKTLRELQAFFHAADEMNGQGGR